MSICAVTSSMNKKQKQLIKGIGNLSQGGAINMNEIQELLIDILNRYDLKPLYLLFLIIVIMTVLLAFKQAKARYTVPVSIVALLGIVFQLNSMFAIQEWADWYLNNQETATALINKQNLTWNCLVFISCVLLLIQIVFAVLAFKKSKVKVNK